LQHDLGNQNGIGIASPPPRVVPAFDLKPPHQSVPETRFLIGRQFPERWFDHIGTKLLKTREAISFRA